MQTVKRAMADDTVVGVGEQLKKVLEEKYHGGSLP